MTAAATTPELPGAYLLCAVLRTPALAAQLGLRQWEQLIWQSRNAELIGQLQARLQDSGMLRHAPPGAQRHLGVARHIARKHEEAVRWELRTLADALRPLGVPVILLKGAAYCAQGNPASVGRIFNDIDILLPKPALTQAEENLTRAGWLPEHSNAYDERYYREWMHEIPPMEHKNRSTVLDVHHTILAPTSGIRPDPQAFFDRATQLGGEWAFFQVLSPQDMVAHSACHLFFGEFHKGLRDLYDLHRLISHFGDDSGFLESLLERSHALGLLQPVLDTLVQSERLFGTTVPQGLVAAWRAKAGGWWPEAARRWLFDQVLRPNHGSAYGPLTPLANWLAFARSHHLRMPPGLLAYHLGHKLLFKS